ncbi:transmembrane anchor protein [Hydrogenophaga sp.]|uniref:transmembrane anchor protein n=1 Tax=Hydrogenophaga sp. TaxID=1904254 RepID=UPI003AF60B3F
MYNSHTPLPEDLPSSRQLLRSTLLAVISAAVLLITVVLPAEYGIDPTGVGRVLRLTEMGEIKQQLAAEAEADAAAPPAAAAPAPAAKATPQTPAPVVEAAQAAPWRDEMRVTLTPGEGAEIKLRMREGDKAEYSWVVEGGAVNFDTHGDGGGRSISYEKGRGVPADDGALVAAFTGNHGWYWRNRGQADVTLVLRTRGTYSDIKRAI